MIPQTNFQEARVIRYCARPAVSKSSDKCPGPYPIKGLRLAYITETHTEKRVIGYVRFPPTAADSPTTQDGPQSTLSGHSARRMKPMLLRRRTSLQLRPVGRLVSSKGPRCSLSPTPLPDVPEAEFIQMLPAPRRYQTPCGAVAPG
jgi:hypothetical protein